MPFSTDLEISFTTTSFKSKLNNPFGFAPGTLNVLIKFWVRELRFFFFHFNDLFNVLSRPVPSITLKKTGTHVTLGTTTGNVNRLVIDSFALHDAGEYMCMASDDSGASNIKSTVITMEGKYLLPCVALRESTYTAISRKVFRKKCACDNSER